MATRRMSLRIEADLSISAIEKLEILKRPDNQSLEDQGNAAMYPEE